MFPETIANLFTQAMVNDTVSMADRYGLMAALLDRELCEAERHAVDQLLFAAKRNSAVLALAA